jgi:putative YphP/YqiW family bacilliredoxin
MRKELANAGFKETQTATDVEQAIKHQPGTTLLVVNSVCGCAAGTCRPGVLQSLKSEIKPDQLITVFAGVDREATQKAREFLLPYPPSSPAIALFKDGQLVHMIERHHIEGRSADMIGNHLKQVYQEYCTEKVN